MPGPRPMTPEQQRQHGEIRPCRQIVSLFKNAPVRPDAENPPPLKGMTPAAKKIWVDKVKVYRERGQSIAGLEDSLEAYCETQAQLRRIWRKNGNAPVNLINTHRKWAELFLDTPASQLVRKGNTRVAAAPAPTSEPAPGGFNVQRRTPPIKPAFRAAPTEAPGTTG